MKIVLTIETKNAQMCIHAQPEGRAANLGESLAVEFFGMLINEGILKFGQSLEQQGQAKIADMATRQDVPLRVAAWEAGKLAPKTPANPGGN